MAGDISRENGKKGGRPKGEASILAERARIRIAQRITEEIEPLVDAQLEKAKKGDTQAFKELLDRGYGKPKEIHEHMGEDGGPLEITIIKYVGDKPTP